MFNPQADVTVTRMNCRDVPLVLVSGGVAGTRRDAHRQGVSQFVADSGAAAGVNGTFFADASPARGRQHPDRAVAVRGRTPDGGRAV